MTNIFLSLGSNIGNRFAHLKKAIHLLSKENKIVLMSSIYETQALGKIVQNSFYNMVIQIETLLSAENLLKNCLQIELEMGRRRIEKWGPRLIDIDIIVFGQTKINTIGLNIPHPEFSKRKFVLVPFSELTMSFKINNRTISDYLRVCKDLSSIKKLGKLSKFTTHKEKQNIVILTKKNILGH